MTLKKRLFFFFLLKFSIFHVFAQIPSIEKERAERVEKLRITAEAESNFSVALNQLIMVSKINTDLFYPRVSKDLSEQGLVALKMFIDETGLVTSTKVIKSSGYARLDRAASMLASNIRFQPYLINKLPSRVNADISVKFKLNHLYFLNF
jgi:TonB family protein